MKSRISFCKTTGSGAFRFPWIDRTVFRKNVTRFAPLWSLYLIGGLLVLLSMTAGYSERSTAGLLGEFLGYFAFVNMIYGCLTAQMLFGDLFQSRLCNALHALPLRRETWFFTHVLSGLAFSVVPHTVATAVLMLRLGAYAYLAPLWMMGMLLEYLFFFGLAVLCVFCTANRVAMATVYGIMNFLALIFRWFVETVYIPLMYGVVADGAIFSIFCPVMWLPEHAGSFLEVGSLRDVSLGSGWIYLTVLAGLGIAFLVVGLLLYRRRALECAGDFMAVKCLKPVFSVACTLFFGGLFAQFGAFLVGQHMLFLAVGIVVGFFVGQMLLNRTVSVFRLRSFGKLALISVLLLTSMLAVVLDVAGIVRWTPEADQIARVSVIHSSGLGDNGLSQQEDIRQVIRIHQLIVRQMRPGDDWENSDGVTIRYEQKDGRVTERNYRMYLSNDLRDALRVMLSNPRYVLGDTDWDSLISSIQKVSIGDNNLEKEQIESFLQAVKADCVAGNMAQDWHYHEDREPSFFVGFTVGTGQQTRYPSLQIYSDAVHTIGWLKENNLFPQNLLKKAN